MVNPTTIRIKLRSNSTATAQVTRKNYEAKQKQIEEAVKYCLDNKCRGKAALKTGRFPLIKDHKTITRRLDGDVKHGEERLAQSILIPSEEKSLLEFAKNKCRALQPLGRKEMTDWIMNLLRLRKHANKTLRGRKRVKLSGAAEYALHKKSVSKYFWMRFDAKYPDVATKRVGTTSLRRALACTRDMAVEHLDELANELIANGIMTNSEKVDEGDWIGDIDPSRVYNLDETPQAINFGENGPRFAYCPRGEACTQIVKENREYVTITPIVCMDGTVSCCQVIFATKGISSSMAPKSAVENIEHLLISTTENGYQDGESFHRLLMTFDKYLDDKNITRPVVLLSDGHSSRFNVNALKFSVDKSIKPFLSPPESTSTTQPLDQINAVLHSSYSTETSKFFCGENVNREIFMTILGSIWSTWVSKVGVVNAFKKCGVSKVGLSVEWMQQDKFKAAEALLAAAALESTSESNKTPTKKADWEVESPDVRKGSLKYYKMKLEAAEEQLKNLSEANLTPADIPGFFVMEKVKPTTSKSKKITQVHGSLEGKKVLELVEAAEIEKNKKLEEKESRKIEKEHQVESYLRCKHSCCCGEKVCVASGLKQCEKCKDVMKSQCSKAKCKDGSTKPSMIQVDYDIKKRKKRKYRDTQMATCSKYTDACESDTQLDDYDEEDLVFEQFCL